jgi:hypothetical protein
LLKVVPTAVWQNARLEDVGFCDAPSIESRFWKERLDKRVVPNLDVTASKTPAFD